MLRITLAVLHLLALALGMAAIDRRARALRRLQAYPDALRDAFKADTWWGIAAGLWIGTGVWRWAAGTEKSPSYYAHNHIFLAKMGILLLILALEVWPMVTLIRWRIARAKGTLPPSVELDRVGRRIANISIVQGLLVASMVVAAVLAARGYGFTP